VRAAEEKGRIMSVTQAVEFALGSPSWLLNYVSVETRFKCKDHHQTNTERVMKSIYRW